ncbi:unnamed protein product [Rotaria sordida]|uniref:Uncharacterized protein n=1 Tax=Rotaria sordida TaxID=392033 RepID=A0A813SVD3_9BILA|nr:unnamed protein product [Rotaria sordida]CAF4050581.1 unnamed protein product [Rotaria sordida]
MLVCYNCPLKHYDYLITPNNIPIFTNCTIDTTTEKFCSPNIYSDDNGKTSELRVSTNMGYARANVSYISTGFDVPNSYEYSRQQSLKHTNLVNCHCIDECRPPFRIRQSSNAEEPCSTYYVTAIKIDSVDLQMERICSYCEQEPKERFQYILMKEYIY